MPQPFISVRKSIRWVMLRFFFVLLIPLCLMHGLLTRWSQLPDPPSEPTSTIVLTSAAGSFIDIRLFKTAERDRVSYVGGNNDEDVEWAFAGFADSSPAKDGRPAHTVWTHWIDSKSNTPVSDEGDMYPQPDGDVLERGNMQKPGTGQNCDYEEVWHDLEIRVLEGENHRICTVLKADSPSAHVKGMLMRVGDWCQGILKTSEGLTIERWQWLDVEERCEEQSSDQGSTLTWEKRWARLARFGSGSLPYPSVLGPRKLANESTVQLDGIEWRVVENYEW